MKQKRSKDTEIILGIDPGSTIIGYGVIGINKKESRNPKPFSIGYGYIDLTGHKSNVERLLQLHDDLNEVLDKYKPDSVALESLFFFKNAKTIVPVLQSRGVILLTVAKANIKVFEYTPLVVKQTISGYGRADKSLVQKLVCSTLNIAKVIKPDDVSDALAIAVCHLRHRI